MSITSLACPQRDTPEQAMFHPPGVALCTEPENIAVMFLRGYPQGALSAMPGTKVSKTASGECIGAGSLRHSWIWHVHMQGEWVSGPHLGAYPLGHTECGVDIPLGTVLLFS